MEKNVAFDIMIQYMGERYDDRSVSDEARRFAEIESGITARPENDGEWKASIEAAFDAGRKYEQLVGVPQ